MSSRLGLGPVVHLPGPFEMKGKGCAIGNEISILKKLHEPSGFVRPWGSGAGDGPLVG